MLLCLIMVIGLNACSNDDDYLEMKRPPYMEEKVSVTIGSQTFILSVFDTPAGKAFHALLPLAISMEDMNGNEKFYRLSQGLSQSLPVDASNPGTIQNGDLMWYGSSTLVLFYKTFSTSYKYTRIGCVDNPPGLQDALGAGSVTVTFELI